MKNGRTVHFTTDYTDFHNRSEAEMAAGKFNGENSCVLSDFRLTQRVSGSIFTL